MKVVIKQRYKKKQKLETLNFLDKNTGRYNPQAFNWVNDYFEKARQKVSLDRKIRNCKRCKGLNLTNTQSAPGFGNLNSEIVFVGQSLCTQCMKTQIPFTEKSGYLLDAAIELSGFHRIDFFITNIEHCHPPNNRTSTSQETRNCLPFIKAELRIVKPKAIITLGSDAAKALIGNVRQPVFKFKHPSMFHYVGFKEAENWVVDLSSRIDRIMEED